MLKNVHVYNPIGRPSIYVVAWIYLTSQTKNIGKMRKWCYDSFGESAPDSVKLSSSIQYKWKDYIAFGEIEFVNEKDLNWFLLKWH